MSRRQVGLSLLAVAKRNGAGALFLKTCAAISLALALSSSVLFGAIPVGPFCGDVLQSALMQNGSLLVDGIASTCGSTKACPGSSGPNTPYLSFAFNNDTGTDQCVTIIGSSPCTGTDRMDLVSYLGSFSPANVCTNYLGDPGSELGGGTSVSSSVIVPAGQNFVVVAAAHRPGNACGQFCFTLGAAACAITCPNNIVVGSGPGNTQCGANVPFSATQNCGAAVSCTASGSPVVSGAFFPVASTNVTCSDGGSQCSFDVTVNDTTPPVATCPAPTSTTASPDACQATVPNVLPSLTVADNCAPGDAISIGCSPPAGTIVGGGTTTITCTTNDGTNQSSCTTGFTVLDVTAPDITCPLDITTSAAQDACTASVSFATPIGTDTCGAANVVCAPASGSPFPVASTPVTCTATDLSNNSQPCTFNVAVEDTQPPAIACPEDVLVNLPNGTSAPVSYAAPQVGDNCQGTTVECVPPSGSVFSIGETTVTCTATDAHQNTNQCAFTVAAQEAPSIPTLDPRALAALAALLVGIGVLLARRR